MTQHVPCFSNNFLKFIDVFLNQWSEVTITFFFYIFFGWFGNLKVWKKTFRFSVTKIECIAWQIYIVIWYYQTYLKCTDSCLLCQHIDKLSSGNRRDQNTLDTWTMIQPNHIHSSNQAFLGMPNRHNDTEIFPQFWLRCHKHSPLFH